MNILEKLKQIGLHFPKLQNITLLNLSLNIDRSIRIEWATVEVNPEKLSGKDPGRCCSTHAPGRQEVGAEILHQRGAGFTVW